MPELPEIETIKHVIEPQITGLDIEKATVLRPEVIAHPAADEFCKAVTGQTVLAMERRGKYLIFHLTQKSRVILHLRMTGCLLVAPPGCPMERHTHVVLQFSNGMELRFSDTRRFGRFWLIPFGEEDTDSGIGKLGPEPFSAGCNAGYLQARLGKRKKAIKACLLDQSVVAGIGNIYSDEILFRANINPARPAGSLTAAEWQRLAAEIPQCLAYFIEKNRTTPEEYWQTKGQGYGNTPFLQVYGHGGEPCPHCGTALAHTVVGGANINPARPAGSLTAAEWQRLAAEIPQCLAYFIEKNRTTPEEYWQTKGQGYGNTPFLQVYGHGGEPCPHCGTALAHTVVGGRSSVYCPHCQGGAALCCR